MRAEPRTGLPRAGRHAEAGVPGPSGARRISPRELVLLSLSRVRGMSQRQLEGALLPGEAEWLAEIRRQPEPELSLAEQLDFPDWLAERLSAAHGGGPAGTGARAEHAGAARPAREHAQGGTRWRWWRAWPPTASSPRPALFAAGLRLKTKPYLQKHPAFLDGSIEVQDEGSQLLGYLLAPRRGEMVVDFCAGAGGKTLILGAMMRSTGRLYAFDVSDKRLAKLKPRAGPRRPVQRASGLPLGRERYAGQAPAGKVDRVLVDAPCSGLGTLRRNPDLKWRQSPQSVDELTAKQGAILAAAAKLLRPGGRLVYATCSILAEENEAIVDGFLATHADFHRLSAQELLAAQGIAIDCGEDMRLSPQNPRYRWLLCRGAGTGQMRTGCVAALLCCLTVSQRRGHRCRRPARSKSCFPPGTTPRARLCARWAAARQSIHVQAYLLTSRSIARALQDARRAAWRSRCWPIARCWKRVRTR
jgi:16S rRNA (cytosine967-C5)-methyltransferase